MEPTGVMNIQDLRLENISVNLVTFYHSVFKEQYNSIDVPSNRKILNNLRKTYAKKIRRDDACRVCFDSVDVRSAYLFQFCPSFTLAMAYHFLMLMKSLSKQQVQRIALDDTLTICCLGGGPGTEVVAICSVLQVVRKASSPAKEEPLLVDAVVVDVEPGWSTTAENVIKSLQDLVDASVVKINDFRFIEHDFTGAMSEDIKEILSQSDVVTMNKFLSALHAPRHPVGRTEILQETWNHIQDGGILFLMDSSGWKIFEEMVRTTNSLPQVEQVYGTAKKTNRMSKTSKKLCVSLFQTIYGGQCCTAQSSNKAAAWRKISSTDDS